MSSSEKESKNPIKRIPFLVQIHGQCVNKKYHLKGPSIIIGRHPKSNIKLDSLNVSGSHCILNCSEGKWSITDNNSQNGTYVNGRKVGIDKATDLLIGDIVFLGPPVCNPEAFIFDDLLDEEEHNTGETSCDKENEGETEAEDLDCAICLMPYIQPVELPCLHKFCFLCVKGIIQNTNKCALCRQDIPSNFLDKPQVIDSAQNTVTFEGSYQWFYEGRNGWWQYDDRSSTDIEEAYQKGDSSCELQIAGSIYVVDFQSCMQYRQGCFGRRRHVKRDIVSIPKKGIAGVHIKSGLIPPVAEKADKPLQSCNSKDGSEKNLKRKIDDVLIDTAEKTLQVMNKYMDMQNKFMDHLIKRTP